MVTAKAEEGWLDYLGCLGAMAATRPVVPDLWGPLGSKGCLDSTETTMLTVQGLMDCSDSMVAITRAYEDIRACWV